MLHKTQAPARSAESLGTVDAVLLSHDHHSDNLDHAGTRRVGRRRPRPHRRSPGRSASGDTPWVSRHGGAMTLEAPGGRWLRITATPARHGPADGDRGPVVGFALAFTDRPEDVVYVSGDTVWYDGVADVGRRFPRKGGDPVHGRGPRAARWGPHHLTLTAEEGVTAARAFGDAVIVPLHFEGWAAFLRIPQRYRACVRGRGTGGPAALAHAGAGTRPIARLTHRSRRDPMATRRSTRDELQTLPGIGPSLARDLRALGVKRVADLRRRDPERLYVRLNRVRGVRQDPCVLYAFRCAAYAARSARPRPELLKWWNWKDRTLQAR